MARETKKNETSNKREVTHTETEEESRKDVKRW